MVGRGVVVGDKTEVCEIQIKRTKTGNIFTLVYYVWKKKTRTKESKLSLNCKYKRQIVRLYVYIVG